MKPSLLLSLSLFLATPAARLRDTYVKGTAYFDVRKLWLQVEFVH